MRLQAFLVAGGIISGRTSTVLTLPLGATVWTPLASLPRPFSSAQASIVGGMIRVVGGYDGSSRSEVMSFHLKVTLPKICVSVIRFSSRTGLIDR